MSSFKYFKEEGAKKYYEIIKKNLNVKLEANRLDEEPILKIGRS